MRAVRGRMGDLRSSAWTGRVLGHQQSRTVRPSSRWTTRSPSSDGVETWRIEIRASPRRGSSLPDLVRQVLSGTRVPTQELPFFGRGSGRIASPAHGRGRRPKVGGRGSRAHGTAAPCLKPCLPSPGALRAPASCCAPLRGARQCGRYAAVWATCGRPPGQARARAPSPRTVRPSPAKAPNMGCVRPVPSSKSPWPFLVTRRQSLVRAVAHTIASGSRIRKLFRISTASDAISTDK